MKRTFAEAMAHRRSYYSIGSDSPVLDEEIVHIIREAVKNVPSAFNSQSTRIVLLLGDEHKKLWNIVKETLKARISAEAFAKTEAKIDGCFASGHGTVLYFEDTSVVKKLQEAFPSYKDNFPTWSQHTSAMHDDVAHGLAQVLVVLHVTLHGLEGVDDGGVVTAGEFTADLFHAHAGDLAQDVACPCAFNRLCAI